MNLLTEKEKKVCYLWLHYKSYIKEEWTFKLKLNPKKTGNLYSYCLRDPSYYGRGIAWPRNISLIKVETQAKSQLHTLTIDLRRKVCRGAPEKTNVVNKKHNTDVICTLKSTALTRTEKDCSNVCRIDVGNPSCICQSTLPIYSSARVPSLEKFTPPVMFSSSMISR